MSVTLIILQMWLAGIVITTMLGAIVIGLGYALLYIYRRLQRGTFDN